MKVLMESFELSIPWKQRHPHTTKNFYSNTSLKFYLLCFVITNKLVLCKCKCFKCQIKANWQHIMFTNFKLTRLTDLLLSFSENKSVKTLLRLLCHKICPEYLARRQNPSCFKTKKYLTPDILSLSLPCPLTLDDGLGTNSMEKFKIRAIIYSGGILQQLF